MSKNLKEIIRNRTPVVGCFVTIPHPASVEACAVEGIDFVCLDAEHGTIGREAMENMLRAADCRQMPTLVRVPDAKSSWIGWALDAGAQGIVVPRVETVADARSVVDAAYYSPRGQRGVGPGRASSYGTNLRAAVSDAHERTSVVVQIETFEGVTNAADIVRVPGIDAVFIGPIDLSQSLLSVPEADRPSLDEAIAAVQKACSAAGCTMGIFRVDYSDRKKWSDFPLLIVGTDVMFMQGGIRAAQAAQDTSL